MNRTYLKLILLVFLFSVIPLLIETLLYPNKNMIVLLSYQMIAFALFLILAIVYPSKLINSNTEVKTSALKYLLFIATPLLILLVTREVSSISDLVVFRERYRNGFILGTGIFLKPITSILSLWLGIIILKNQSITKWVYIGISLCLITSFIFGLRIFLFPIVLGAIIRFLLHFNLIRSLVLITILGGSVLISKILIKQDASLTQVISSQITRTNYHTLAYFDGIDNNNNIICTIKPLNLLFNCDINTFKKKFFLEQSHPLVQIPMDYVIKYTGIAIPLGLYIYNNYGKLLIGIQFLLITLVFYFLIKTIKSTSNYQIYFSFLIIFLGVLIEDINFINKWMEFIPISIMLKTINRWNL